MTTDIGVRSMTDHSTARAHVEKLRKLASWWGDEESEAHARTVAEAADFIEQSLTPPEGDTVSPVVFAAGVRGILHRHGGLDAAGEWSVRAAAEIAEYAASSRVSPQEGMREALEEARTHILASNEAFGSGPEEEKLLAKIDAALSASRMSEDANNVDRK